MFIKLLGPIVVIFSLNNWAQAEAIRDFMKFCGNDAETKIEVCLEFSKGKVTNSLNDSIKTYEVRKVSGSDLVFVQGDSKSILAFVLDINWQYELISVDSRTTGITSGTKMTLVNPWGPCEQDPASC